MASQNAVASTPWRMLLALAGSLALHAVLLAGLNLRPLPEVTFDNAARRVPLAVALVPLTPLDVALKVEPAASRAGSKTSTVFPPHAKLWSDQPGPQTPVTAEQAIQMQALPRFTVDDLRQQARTLDQVKRQDSAVAPQNLGRILPPLALEQDTPLSHSIAKASRPDCKTAYSGWGLLGIPALIYATATESGCQW